MDYGIINKIAKFQIKCTVRLKDHVYEILTKDLKLSL